LRAGEPGIAQRGAFRCLTQQSIRSPSRKNFAAHSPPSALGSKREGLEQELARLKEELRQSREASSSDAHPGGAVNLEH
jgi:hypothetical protein